jgi:curved DNA-binding protein CbpA
MNRGDRDPYSLLGVPRQASAFDISRAYRRAARATHPDARPGDAAAADRFSALNDAYEMLRDPVRRAAYDRAHPDVVPARPLGPPPVDLVALSRRGRRRVVIDGYLWISWRGP